MKEFTLYYLRTQNDSVPHPTFQGTWNPLEKQEILLVLKEDGWTTNFNVPYIILLPIAACVYPGKADIYLVF